MDNIEKRDVAFEYKGRIYVSPMDRGTDLIDLPDKRGIGLESAVSDGYYYIEVKIFKLSEDEERKADKHLRGR